MLCKWKFVIFQIAANDIKLVKVYQYWNGSDETQPLIQTRVSENHEWVGTLNEYSKCFILKFLKLN